MHCSNQHTKGLTLIELLVTVSILGILIAIATPNLYHFYANQRLAVLTQQFTHTLSLARSNAIRHNSTVVLCPVNSSSQCTQEKDWQRRWIIFNDVNHNSQHDDGEVLFKKLHFDDHPVNITSNRKRPPTFYHHGKSPGSNATFLFCDERGGEYAKAVILSNSGRFRIVSKKSDGSALKC